MLNGLRNGIKTQLLDNSMRMNLSILYTIMKIIKLAFPGNPNSTQVLNAPGADIHQEQR